MATENPRVWFKSISLENVRSFGTKQTINFTDKDGNAARWNVILGDNGTGKTTVLKGLVLTISAKFGNNRFAYSKEYFYSLKRWGPTTSIKIDAKIEQIKKEEISEKEISFASAEFSENLILPVTDIGGRRINIYNESDEKLFLCAYGAARRISEGAITEERNTYYSLFSEDIPLINAEEWLVQAEYISLKNKQFTNRYKSILEVVRRLFSTEAYDVYVNVESSVPKVFFRTPYGDVRLHELSLGYKTLIAWMVDFANGLFDEYPNSKNPLAEPAVCLVDEIDLHLHPKFQRTIIKFLTDTFENTQFIVTAHSPLIVQSAEDANIIVLKREGNETVVEADRINVHDWRIDQILSSDMFGGIGGRAPDVEEKIKRRRTLLRKDKLTDSEQTELANLEKELGNLPVSESREALKALDIIGQALINQ
jgi:predicted ATPase